MSERGCEGEGIGWEGRKEGGRRDRMGRWEGGH